MILNNIEKYLHNRSEMEYMMILFIMIISLSMISMNYLIILGIVIYLIISYDKVKEKIGLEKNKDEN